MPSSLESWRTPNFVTIMNMCSIYVFMHDLDVSFDTKWLNAVGRTLPHFQLSFQSDYMPYARICMNIGEIRELISALLTCAVDPIPRSTFSWPYWEPENGFTMGREQSTDITGYCDDSTPLTLPRHANTPSIKCTCTSIIILIVNISY